jgi:hypothetical protein
MRFDTLSERDSDSPRLSWPYLVSRRETLSSSAEAPLALRSNTAAATENRDTPRIMFVS